jgi:hypothetical protein
MGGYYGGPPSDQQPSYPQGGYQPQGYPPPPGYPVGQHPPGYGYPPPGYGYPVPNAPRVSVVWTGWLLAVGGLAATIGSFLTWIHAVAGGATQDFSGISGDRDGKITVVFGVLLLAGGVLIVVKQGRLWVSITGIVLAAILAFIALADIGDVSDKSKRLAGFGRLDVGVGLVLVLLGALVALAFSIVALCVRRPADKL